MGVGPGSKPGDGIAAASSAFTRAAIWAALETGRYGTIKQIALSGSSPFQLLGLQARAALSAELSPTWEEKVTHGHSRRVLSGAT